MNLNSAALVFGNDRADMDAFFSLIPLETFLESVSETNAAVTGRLNMGEVSRVFHMRMLNDLLWARHADLATFVRVNKAGQEIEFPSLSATVDNDVWVRRQYNNGATVVVNGVEGHATSVASAAIRLGTALDAKVSVNAYLTPPGSQGFDAHFDTHDVFVLQIAGEKTWHTFDAAVELPLAQQARRIDTGSIGEENEVITLAKGDVLYVPRGVVHRAEARDSMSLHLTFGVYPRTWTDLIQVLFAFLAENDTELRRRLPPHEGCEAIHESLLRALTRVLPRLADPDMLSTAMALWDQIRLGSQRALPSSSGLLGTRPPVLELQTLVRRRPEMRCVAIRQDDEVRLTFPGLGLTISSNSEPGYIAAPLLFEEAIRYVARTESTFSVDALPGHLPPNAKLALAKRLVGSGLLELAQPRWSQQLARQVEQAEEV